MEDKAISNVHETEDAPLKEKFCKSLVNGVKHAKTVCESSSVSSIEPPVNITGSEKSIVPAACFGSREIIYSDNSNIQISLDDSKVKCEEKIVCSVLRAYVCALCNKAFSQPNHLHTHMRTHSGDRPFSCLICGRRFSQRANLLRHEQMHTGNRPHLCDLCGKSFIQKVALRDHKAAEHSSTPRVFSCKLCQDKFDDRAELTNHVREDHPEHRLRSVPGHTNVIEKPYTCVTCGKPYATSGGLRMHMRVHGGMMFSCTLCEKSYVNAALLRQHSATHSREKEFACTTCGKAFIYRNALHVHRRTHTGEKPYKCMVCGHAYTQYGHLQSHMKTHTGEKPHVCDVCGKSYRQKVDLNLHKRRLPCAGKSV